MYVLKKKISGQKEVMFNTTSLKNNNLHSLQTISILVCTYICFACEICLYNYLKRYSKENIDRAWS